MQIWPLDVKKKSWINSLFYPPGGEVVSELGEIPYIF